MANKLEPLTVDTAERLDDAKAGLDALELMTDAFLLGNEEYDPQETAEAMHRVIDAARADIAAAKAEIKAAIKASRTA